MTVDHAAIWHPSPNFWAGRGGQKPRWIIVHGTAGGGAVEWLCKPWNDGGPEASAHYVIKQSGEIYQLVDEDDSAWGNGYLSEGHDPWWTLAINPNTQTISIEHEKPDKYNQTPLTPAQVSASYALIGRICQRWNIPTRAADASGGITGHFSIDPVNRSECPGGYPWDGLYKYLNQTHGEAPTMLQIGQGMGQYFTDLSHDAIKRWHCTKTNVYIIGDNLDFYRRYEGVFGLPLTNEIYLQQYPGTAIVCYERGVAAYDPKRKLDNPPGAGSVYLMHIDGGIGQQLIAKPLVAALNKQIADAQNQVKSLNAEIDTLRKQQPTQDVKALEAKIATLQTQSDTYHHALQVVLATAQPFK